MLFGVQCRWCVTVAYSRERPSLVRLFAAPRETPFGVVLGFGQFSHECLGREWRDALQVEEPVTAP